MNPSSAPGVRPCEFCCVVDEVEVNADKSSKTLTSRPSSATAGGWAGAAAETALAGVGASNCITLIS